MKEMYGDQFGEFVCGYCVCTSDAFTHLKKEVVRNPNKRQMYLQPPPFDQNIQANQTFQVIPVREDN